MPTLTRKQKEVLEIMEDLAFAVLVEDRMKNTSDKTKWVSHEEAWELPKKKK